jgi:hypothetical protein
VFLQGRCKLGVGCAVLSHFVVVLLFLLLLVMLSSHRAGSLDIGG